jgi:hypothetical protein
MQTIGPAPAPNKTLKRPRLTAEMPKTSKKLNNSVLTPKFRAEQYPKQFYHSGNQLFCRVCQHTIDWKRKDTCDDHLKSKIHLKNSESRSQGTALQTTITSTISSADSRVEFIEDFVAVCAASDIPLEKLKKLRPFLVKHCKQGGALPQNASSLRQTHLPRVFDQHMTAVLKQIRGKKFAVVVDETTDARDCSVLNIVIGELT